MKSEAVVLLCATMASLCVTAAIARERSCGTIVPTQGQRADVFAQTQRFQSAARAFLEESLRSNQPLEIQVRFHIVHLPDGTGNVSDAEIASQRSVLDAAYRPMGITFRYLDTRRHADSAWFNTVSGSPVDLARMTQINTNPGSQLLIIVRKARARDRHGRETDVLGYAYFPWQLSGPNKVLDSTVVDWETLPREEPESGLGMTAVHEVGHWLSLYHTFDPEPNGCDDPGDSVADTAAEMYAASRCPVNADTCPAAGLDPVDNYMDYSWDSCMTRFTPGQAERVLAGLAQYRPTLLRSNPTSRKMFYNE